jgi:nucleoside-diphosphate-sugar epimerase
MPAVTAPAKVLVTGANGFIAAATVKTLIERGFSVIGTVRTAAKGEYMKNQFGSKFEYTVVPDLEKVRIYKTYIYTSCH